MSYPFFPPLNDTSIFKSDTIGSTDVRESEGQASSSTKWSISDSPKLAKANLTSARHGVFNISWGGRDDRPPFEPHREGVPSPTQLSKPLPKPRGIRKHPEPAPSKDGSLDEDTIKRRKVRV
ncbi:hypothetical protein DM01DRAFT_304251 [Hesseltinella vesiculosa]|uniref:Uncharacterized protein n=1 Tax=Hesseltinella vesiculosa TaxID=101127 RepID=A0A1X2G2C6_9FUNG|nr:hypothetical protein DM01DRAFT_304251 [Hesseltinella vesiculosa]